MWDDARPNPGFCALYGRHTLGLDVIMDDMPVQDVHSLAKDHVGRQADLVFRGYEMQGLRLTEHRQAAGFLIFDMQRIACRADRQNHTVGRAHADLVCAHGQAVLNQADVTLVDAESRPLVNLNAVGAHAQGLGQAMGIRERGGAQGDYGRERFQGSTHELRWTVNT